VDFEPRKAHLIIPSMPATTEALLFDYESAIEDALATALSSLLTGTQILTARTTQASQEKKTTPRIELALAVTGSPEHHNRDRGNVEYRDTRQGTVSFLCAARRDDSNQSLGTLRGTLRANIRKGKALLTASNLPYYEVYFFEETAAQPQFDADNDEIQCIVMAEIEWQIKPDQFPTP
jgi:hypothetical protein